jgi:S1-C subfamily serine protease
MESTSQTETETLQTLQTQELTQTSPAPPEPTTPENNQNQAPPAPPERLPTYTTSPKKPQHSHTNQIRKHALPAIMLTVLIATSFVSAISMYSIYSLNVQVSSLQSEISTLQSAATANGIATAAYVNTTGASLSALYADVENSVVTIKCTITEYTSNPWGRQTPTTATVQGSGFVYQYNGEMVIITNNHVIDGATAITVTFTDGNVYDATLLGGDSTTDIAVLSCTAPESEYYPLEIVSSSAISVGDSVVAIGSPYGLSGTMTTGIISSLDRTITVTEDTGGSYEMTGLIQTSAPINSGNSGGPLMTYNGQVIGITTAIVSDSDGLSFAVPSNTILIVISELLS